MAARRGALKGTLAGCPKRGQLTARAPRRAQPDLDKFTFQGTLDVALDVLAATKTVVCHAHEARAPASPPPRPPAQGQQR